MNKNIRCFIVVNKSLGEYDYLSRFDFYPNDKFNWIKPEEIRLGSYWVEGYYKTFKPSDLLEISVEKAEEFIDMTEDEEEFGDEFEAKIKAFFEIE